MHGLEEVGWQDVKLRGGFWGPRLDIHHRATVPHVNAKLDERKHTANFDVAARMLKSGSAKQGAAAPDRAGEALEGACYTLGHCDDPALHQRVDGIPRGEPERKPG